MIMIMIMIRTKAPVGIVVVPAETTVQTAYSEIVLNVQVRAKTPIMHLVILSIRIAPTVAEEDAEPATAKTKWIVPIAESQ